MGKTGPWQIVIGPVDDAQWHGGVEIDGALTCERQGRHEQEIVEQIKDAWRAEMGEPFTDQDFTVVRVGVEA